jgi:effector-binding domain-containing protein
MAQTTAPRIETRPEQPYVGVRTQVPMTELGTVIPQLHSEAMTWLKSQGLKPSGPPFVRYHVINMEDKLDIEMGWPTATKLAGNGRVQGGVLPAGKYASVLYMGDYSGLMEANRVLVDWAKDNNIAWDRWDAPNGDAFRSRYESYITDPGDEPDPNKWQTEVAIKLADQ